MGAPPVLGFLKEGMYHERVPLQMFKRTGSLHPLPLFVCALPIFVTFPPDAVVHPGKPVSGQTRQQLHVGAGGTERRLRADVLSTQGLCCWNELAFFKKKHSSFLIFSDRTDRRMFAIVHFFCQDVDSFSFRDSKGCEKSYFTDFGLLSLVAPPQIKNN